MIDRASWRTVNQVTAKKKMKMIKEIENVAKKKLPSTKWTGRGRGGRLTSAEAPDGRRPDFGVWKLQSWGPRDTVSLWL